MQTFRQLLLAAATSLALAASAFAADTLKMGVEAAYPPFNNKDASGQVVGFDVEIGQALCAKMKTECEIVTSDWDGIIPALNDNKFDFIVSSMSISDERKAAVDFTEPYYSNKLQFIAAKSSDIKGNSVDELKASLNGKTIGAQRGTLSDTWINDNWGSNVTVKQFDSQENAYLELTSGRLDAILSDKYVSYEWLKSDAGKPYEFKGNPVYDNDKIGIAVRKGDDLRTKLNLALKQIIEDGTYKKINDKYFPFSIL